MKELIIDSFAGGGGASTGIEMALGRSPDVAINHDDEALAMHAANHPDTVHLSSNIWQVDPADVAKGRPVGLLWASPDCKHFSKAKGGKPVNRSIRDLAWVVVLWAKRARPRVIVLENVEEFQDWGPLVADAEGRERPCPDRKGATFRKFVGELKREGYRVDWRELRACDYGAPTIRKRLFLIARRDGLPIAWPAPTHGAPGADGVLAGILKPWRTAAECIDWSLPCPSIFMTKDEAAAWRAETGRRVNRPLAEATMARIARGVKRYVLDAKEPFIIRTDMASAAARNGVNGIDEPLRTQTTAGSHALVTPFLAPRYQEKPGQNPRTRPLTVPAATIVTGGNVPGALVAPFMVPRYGERPGQAPRALSAGVPMPTVVPTGNGASVVAAFLAKHYGDRGQRPGSELAEPTGTVTATDHHSLVAAHMLNLRGSDRRDSPADAPARTFSAGGNHAALVAAFLIKYYGQGIGAHLSDPLHTDTARDRFGFVTVAIAGEPYVIVDIGMRMLTARERFLAQGFPAGYVIDQGPDGRPLTGEAQGRMCGNSVCPPVAAAIVSANCGDLAGGEVAA